MQGYPFGMPMPARAWHFDGRKAVIGAASRAMRSRHQVEENPVWCGNLLLANEVIEWVAAIAVCANRKSALDFRLACPLPCSVWAAVTLVVDSG
jgi:hypothetical protein